MSDKPRAFLFMPYIPFPVDRGTYQRVYHLFVELAKSFDIDLACLQEDPERDMVPFVAYTKRRIAIPFKNAPWQKLFPDRLLNPLPTTVAHWQVHGVSEALHAFVAGQDYQRVIFIDLVLWPYIKELFPAHPNVIMDRSRVDWLFQTEELNTLSLSFRERLLRKENLRKIAQLEREAYAAIAGMIVCGWDDRDFLQKKLGKSDKIFVLANGFNEVFFDASTHPRQLTEAPSFLFCGALDYSPNVDAINWFADEIWPLVHRAMPDAVWRIIGKSPDARSQAWGQLEGVDLVGEVPDVRPYYQSSWAQVVPLRIGGGTRLKIVESLGMRCPVLSTTLGAQGLDLPPEESILLADDPQHFANALIRVLQDPELRQNLETNGLAVVQANYRWEQLGQKLTNYIQNL
ncbi:glycosyltransferase family 4 protein [Coraliomargarita sp. SDUM461004]|uniref:Glycosyltransferase family 4 protein n=1 Tax=Thalassobacterium sedimentorum TaxID=3041258 RepID=A0ABU1AGH5_9BACT|nr:glycosyltransferase family 4 protein [Coraliomargarita sp. SDUM461004]MDQ8193792.1 glycosyltransferase family 4 protein [Coraliomargarita sp. SDUM461004]